MSVDTEVFSKKRVALADLNLGEGWKNFGGEVSFDGGSWQVIVSEPDETDDGEYLYAVTLEPVGAPQTAVDLLTEVVTAVARQTHGVTSDPSSGDLLDFRT